MPICLRIVKTSEEKNLIYRLRYKVFVEEERRFYHHLDHIIDRYDSFEETVNILALENNMPIATIRVTKENSVGLPSSEYYDFSGFRKTLEGKCACLGWLCALKKYRRHQGLILGLFKMSVREMKQANARHILAILHPPVFGMLKRLFGAKQAGEEFLSKQLNVPMIPVHIDIDFLPDGARETFQDPMQIIFKDSYERRIYHKEEIIIKKGESGKEAFLIMRGSVRLLPISQDNKKLLPKFEDKFPLVNGDILLGPGQIFGELALIDGGARTISVITNSIEVDVMVWSLKELLEQLKNEKSKAFEVCKLLAVRLRQQIEGVQVNPSESLVARILIDASCEGKTPVNMDWLAKQCGIWSKELEMLVMSWVEKKWINLEKNASIYVINVGAIEERIVKF